jgi:hypothetical protein
MEHPMAGPDRYTAALRDPVQAPRRPIRALELAGRDNRPPSLGTRLRAATERAWRWLARAVRLAVLAPAGGSQALLADPNGVRQLIRDTRFALVTTRDRDGTLHSEPMEASHRTFDGELWFTAPAAAPIVARVRRRAPIQVTYVDANSNRCVVLDGIARICTDAAARNDTRTFIRVDIVSADAWD